MSIDWKSRIKNKTFWISLIGAVVLLSQQLGFNATQFIPSNYVDIINSLFGILTILGIVIDPSSEGIGDKTIDSTENKIQVNEEIANNSTSLNSNFLNNTDISASSKIVVDNPDNEIFIDKEVTATTAVKPN